MIEGLEWIRNSNAEIMRVFDRTKPYMAEDNLYMLAILGDNVCEDGMDAQIRMAKEDPAYMVKATKAQEFDSLWCTKFYRLLALGMLIRAHEEELEKEQSPEGREALEWGKKEAERMHSELAEFLEENLNYSVIPINTLVNIQLECGIKTALHIHKVNSEAK